MMRELDVRRALHETEIKRHLSEDPTSLVVDELGILEGKFRIDVAVIGKTLHGYEIKSASDNLVRLPAQQDSYNKIFDRMTLVVDESHVAEAVKIIPSWWGLIAVSQKDGQPYLNEIWSSRLNLNVDPHSLCQLLWREEALKILDDLGLATSVRNRSRTLMWKLVAAVLDPHEVRDAVSRTLRTRTSWRLRVAKITSTVKPRRTKKKRKPKKRTYKIKGFDSFLAPR